MVNPMQVDHKTEVAANWASIGTGRACELLSVRYERYGRSSKICCLWHNENDPSCSVTIGNSGTLRFHCFACDESWDIFSAIAQREGLSAEDDFPKVLVRAAELVGRWDVVDAVEGREVPREARPMPKREPQPKPEPEPTYPPLDEISELLSACVRVDQEPSVWQWLHSRGIDSHDVAVRDLALAMPAQFIPEYQWSRFRGRSWGDLAHRLIMPVYGPSGSIMSVRAGRVENGSSPKRLPPSGYMISGLVMLDAMGREAFKAGGWPSWNPNPPKFVVVEGEPDFLTMAIQTPINQGPPDRAVIGIFSGAWCDEIAAAIPDGATVIVATDKDATGDMYAMKIKESVEGRCEALRLYPRSKGCISHG